MKRLLSLVVILAVVPASVASATELEDLLSRSQEASFSGQQVISCSTPDGVRDAVVRISQDQGEIRLSSSVSDEVEVSAGFGGFELSRGGGVVSTASVEADVTEVEPLYLVEDTGNTSYLGRLATTHQLIRDGVLRAELVFDAATGALFVARSFEANGTPYCERRFIEFDGTRPGFEHLVPTDPAAVTPGADLETKLPEEVAGFIRIDLHEDEDGFRFAYYSDGFFSFAVFETPGIVTLDAATNVDLGGRTYTRLFTPGRATYAWEPSTGGMALVGDLPPDLHEEVLASLPQPYNRGLFRRVWRSLFG